MVDVVKVISDAYELYRENWRSVITAFGVLFLISLVFGLVNFFAQLPGNFICDGAKNIWLLLIFCISPAILQSFLGIVNGLLSVIITMAVIKPMDEMALGKTISNWTGHFSKQFVNAILVILLRTAVFLISFAPLIFVVILNISALAALQGSKNFGILLGGGLLTILLTLVLGIVVSTILNFLLMFLEVEIVLGEGNIFKAAMKSASVVKNNLVDVILWGVVWFLIQIAVVVVTILVACTLCLLPVAYLITPLIVEPIGLLSKVILWRRLKRLG